MSDINICNTHQWNTPRGNTITLAYTETPEIQHQRDRNLETLQTDSRLPGSRKTVALEIVRLREPPVPPREP
ncbi:hypothetical protein E2C01_004113 [Portunus trituberculatus]|uniref:Uncharacterized protein n=1 Tax=Portunus trituberculatus TaxID=210409 RepID=A0A5B7CT41_PORTR|nr:hypothetical protein [Portunus trituberculatus]